MSISVELVWWYLYFKLFIATFETGFTTRKLSQIKEIITFFLISKHRLQEKSVSQIDKVWGTLWREIVSSKRPSLVNPIVIAKYNYGFLDKINLLNGSAKNTTYRRKSSKSHSQNHEFFGWLYDKFFQVTWVQPSWYLRILLEENWVSNRKFQFEIKITFWQKILFRVDPKCPFVKKISKNLKLAVLENLFRYKLKKSYKN